MVHKSIHNGGFKEVLRLGSKWKIICRPNLILRKKCPRKNLCHGESSLHLTSPPDSFTVNRRRSSRRLEFCLLIISEVSHRC
ncbi:hypothetical protein EUTSA_v10019393mg [Eutrema salsugineum]|uniref:Uncharacterized protein n=1 Tax=Eutrema salsugineum TaxID=72664 RepID=V4K8F2_EUTSA|nr:hypothetical protein EUTSA_v10019393mg [Eutrema salsugineum]ESQ27309.1 hypothetical protein EUTSA_v10019393mg [Eutrema salsugineum]